MGGRTDLSLLEAPLIRVDCAGAGHRLSLPQVLAALVRDEIDSFRALRRHQAPAWHMFLAQTAALALHRAELAEPPDSAEFWASALRGLTTDFPSDEPWHLVVDAWSKPAFLQAPVPPDVQLKNEVATPDALDMLITSKNHDVKQAIAKDASEDDWIFALVSLQTMEGYGGGQGTLHRIARMKSGMSSRVLLGLAPMPSTNVRSLAPRWGARFRRDVRQMLLRRKELLQRFPLGYRETGGLALLWTAPWAASEQLSFSSLDIWFVEICRRIRLGRRSERLVALAVGSKKPRVDSETVAGAVGDPWAPLDRSTADRPTTLNLGDRDFDYELLSQLLSDERYELPLLMKLGDEEPESAANWALVAQAFARGAGGKTRTDGFRERVIPVTGRVARGLGRRRAELHQISHSQISEIKKLNDLLDAAIGVFVRGGVYWQDVPKKNQITESKRQAKMSLPFRDALEVEADRRFFEALWARFDAQLRGDAEAETSTRKDFVMALIKVARALLAEALADLPCVSIRSPRARARAAAVFERRLRSARYGFPEYFQHERQEAADDS